MKAAEGARRQRKRNKDNVATMKASQARLDDLLDRHAMPLRLTRSWYVGGLMYYTSIGEEIAKTQIDAWLRYGWITLTGCGGEWELDRADIFLS